MILKKNGTMIEFSKKSPNEVSEVEKDQLRFLIDYIEINELLERLNPSLSWLPFFCELKKHKPEIEIENWVSKNFNDYHSLKTVVKNLHLFTSDSAILLKNNLNRTSDLNIGIKECWHYIVKFLK